MPALLFQFNLDLTGLESAITGFLMMISGAACLFISFVIAMVVRSQRGIPVFKQRSGAFISGSIIPLIFGFAYLVASGNGSHEFKKTLDSSCFLYSFFVLIITISIIMVCMDKVQKETGLNHKKS
ncbi:MAG: hypothetical protein IAF38_00330 [Bacteroidia bacterium]|nr:hypothetical protein [Bacteroidia bacterium]